MIVKTLFGRANSEISFSDGLVVKFNSAAEAEVDEVVGKMLVEKYPRLVFLEAPESKPKLVADELNENHIVALNAEIIELKSQLETKRKEIEVLNADMKSWKDMVEVKVKEIDFLKTENEGFKTNFKKLQDRYDLHVNLLTSSPSSLHKTCEKSGFTKSEWEGLSKENLIEYMLNKS